MESKKAKIGSTCQGGRMQWRNQNLIASCAKEYFRADLIDVSNMPDEWVPRRAGPILANYLKKVDKDETTILQELDVNFAKLNGEINAKIRTLAENLNSIIYENKMRINFILDKLKTIVVKFSDEHRDKALVEIKQLYSQRVDEIATFKKEAMALERARSDSLHELLNNHCQRLLAVGKQPTNVVHDFDKHAYEANMQLLSNARAYSELEAKLYAQADNEVSLARSHLIQLYLGIRFVSSYSHQPPIGPSDADSGIRDVEGFKESFELIANKYRNELQNGFNNFTKQLIDLRSNIENHHDKGHVTVSFESSKLREINQEYLQLVIDAINRQLIDETLAESLYKNEHRKQRITAELGEELQLTFNILNDAGHLLDGHVMRSALTQKIITTAVEDLITTNDSNELKNEIQFNIEFEKMRTCPESYVLKRKYDVLVDNLKKLAKLYNKHSEEEIRRVERFMNFHKTSVDILLAEIQSLLEQYRIDSSDTSEIPIVASFVSRKYSSSDSPIVLETQRQIVALQNWRNIFLQTLRDNTASIANALNLQATRWVDEKINILNVRYFTKMYSHSIRRERVQAARQMREAELQHHQDRLDSHLNALFNLIKPLPIEASKILSIDSPSLYPLCDWVSKIQTDMDAMLARDPLDPEFKKLKMASYMKRLTKHRARFELSLDAAIEVYKKSVEKQLLNAMHSNLKFISAIKLFSEGGNYSVAEALRISEAAVEVAVVMNSTLLTIHQGLKFRRNQLLNAADLVLKPLLIRDEDELTSPKKLKTKNKANKLKVK